MKKIKMILGIIGIAALLAGCGKSVEQQIGEQMDLGQKYLAEGNYEEAIVAFSNVIELEPKAYGAYMGIVQSYESQAEYKRILNVLDKGIQAIGLDMLSPENVEQVVDTYNRLADYFSQQGDIKTQISCYKKILLLQPNNQEVLRKEEVLRIVEKNKGQLEEIACSIINESYDFKNIKILNNEFQTLVKEIEDPVIISVEEGRYLGVYPDGYMFYGKMENGIRKHGIWYRYVKRFRATSNETLHDLYIFDGSWESEKPNGLGTMIEVSLGNPLKGYCEITGNFVNGLLDGNATTKIATRERQATYQFQTSKGYTIGIGTNHAAQQIISYGSDDDYIVNCEENSQIGVPPFGIFCQWLFIGNILASLP